MRHSARCGTLAALVRICIVYDCLFPYTVGGGERWYRNLAQRLAADGHDVTYLTLRQWPKGERGEVPGVRVIAAGPRMALYGDGGQRRVAPPLVFGAGVLWHLLRHGRSYDVVHTASFPYFSLLAAALLRPLGRYRIVVDWFELWSEAYWREYLGDDGRARRARRPAPLPARPPEGVLLRRPDRGPPARGGPARRGRRCCAACSPARRRRRRRSRSVPLVVFAGRHIPEKRAPAVVGAVALAHVPDLRGLILGDGPEYEAVLAEIAARGVADRVEAPGLRADRAGRARARPRAVPRAALAPRGLRPRRRRGRVAGHAFGAGARSRTTRRPS